MKKALFFLVLLFAVLFSCIANNGDQTTETSKFVLIIDQDVSKAVIIEEYEVLALDIIITEQDSSEIIQEILWEKDSGSNRYELELPVDLTYNLDVNHRYIDDQGIEHETHEGPYEFSLKPGYVTKITIIPGMILDFSISVEDTFSVTGKIVDQNQQPVEGVKVSLSENSGFFALTDEEGKYALYDIPNDEYTVEVEKTDTDFVPFGFSRKVSKTGNTTLNFMGFDQVLTHIHTIQGSSHLSVYNNVSVSNVVGIVTAKTNYGFYMQDLDPDNDMATSEGIYVYSYKPSVNTGDWVIVNGTVSEYYPGGISSNNLSLTEIKSPVFTVILSGQTLPAPIVLGISGRNIPQTIICDDSSEYVEDSVFDPENDGIDFYESMECMLVQVNQPMVIAPKSSYNEIYVVADRGAGSSSISTLSTLTISEGDMNPELLVFDDGIISYSTDVHTGDYFNGSVKGIIDYNYGLFKIYPIADFPELVLKNTVKEVTNLISGNSSITIASFNVENLSAVSDQSKFDQIAAAIVNNLKSPDIVCLLEIMDDNGEGTGIVSADLTFQKLIQTIQSLSPDTIYSYTNINPVENEEGGITDGNIRVGMLYKNSKISLAPGIAGDSITPVQILVDDQGMPYLSLNPGRIDPANAAFWDPKGSRRSLAVQIKFNDQDLFIVINHFSSKGGDDPLWGRVQPPYEETLEQRIAQANVIADFVSELLTLDSQAKVIVLGDLNDFYFSQPLNILKARGLVNLVETLTENERFTYTYLGNAQTLDHILLSSSLYLLNPNFDIVHINSVFNDDNRCSDHDPLICRISF